MEQPHQQHHTEPETDITLDGYDAVPRDGPAVFVADTTKLDHGELHGRWIGLDQPTADIATEISRVTERSPIDGGWAVVDQTRLGATMCDEAITFDGLTRLARLHRQVAGDLA
jgi:hypothetical protein